MSVSERVKGRLAECYLSSGQRDCLEWFLEVRDGKWGEGHHERGLGREAVADALDASLKGANQMIRVLRDKGYLEECGDGERMGGGVRGKAPKVYRATEAARDGLELAVELPHVVDVLRLLGSRAGAAASMTANEVAKASAGVPRGEVFTTLKTCARKGYVVRRDGVYAISENGQKAIARFDAVVERLEEE